MENTLDIIKDYFKDLTFQEEGHKYYIGNEKVHKSVSNLISDHYEPFPVLEASKNKAKKLGLSQEEVLTLWNKEREESCKNGSKVHLFGENYIFDKSLIPSSKKEEAIVKFYKELPDEVIPIGPEITMYHKKKKFAGTADLLFYNTRTNKYIIADYKTNKDLFKNYSGKRMLGIFNGLLDNPFNHYQIQLSLYQTLFEQVSQSFEVSHRKIVWLLPDGQYQLYDTIDYTKELKQYYKC